MPKPTQIRVSKEMIQTYADASGDHNPLHLDEAYARKAGLEKPIAHGMLILGLSLSALEDWGLSMKGIRKLRTRFKEKVAEGDTIEISLMESKKDHCQIKTQVGAKEVLSLDIEF